MNTSYPRHHLFHSHEPIGGTLPPLCAYCLHLLGTAPVSPARRRELEDSHVCVEKSSVRQPAVSLPFN
jgi:hypothetical protein